MRKQQNTVKKHSISMPYLSLPGKRNDELSYVFSEPDIENAKTTISLCGIFHAQSTLPIYHIFIEQAVKNFLDFFHRSPDDIEHIFGSDDISPYEFVFEHSLQYTNEHLSRALQELTENSPKTASIDLQKVHFILGAIMDGSLFLCTHGKAVRAYLLYPTKSSNPSAPYSLVDILQSTSDAHDDSPQRLFSSVISGKISIPQSKLVICNQSFLDYVSLEQLKHSLTNQKTEQLTQYFHHLLSRANAKSDFAAIFIDPWNVNTSSSKREQRNTISHSSIENLLEKQRGTTTILKQRMVNNFFRIASALVMVATQYSKYALSKGLSIIRSLRSFHESKQLPKKIITTIHSSLAKGVPVTVGLVSRFKIYIITFLVPFSRRALIRLAQSVVFHYNSKFRPLPTNSKALFIVCLLFALLFIQSLFSISNQRSVRKSEAHQQDLLNKVEQNLNLAEASIIYESDEKTKEMLSVADAMIHEIQSQQLTNKELSNKFTHLSDRYDLIEAKISRIINISSPTIVATLDEKIPSPETIRFAGKAKSLVLTNGDSIYTVEVKDGTVKQVNTQSKIASIPCAASFAESLIFICSGSNRLFAYNTKENSIRSAPYSDGGRALTDIALFNKRLYTLDGSKGVIARHDRKGVGFGEGSLWIRDGSSVQNARQFAIDGNLYVLLNSATIDVYNAGEKIKTIPLPALKNPITEIAQLWTTDQTDYLYLLDSLGKRILVLDKRTFAYILSVSSPYFSQGVQDILASSTDLFVLAGGKLLSIPLEKIKL